jgi:hypothetical protein
MIERSITVPDKKDKNKAVVEEYLMCPQCFVTISIDKDVRVLLDSVKKDGYTTINKKDLKSGKITEIKPTEPTIRPARKLTGREELNSYWFPDLYR